MEALEELEHVVKRRRVEEAIHILRKYNYDEDASLAFSSINNFMEQTQEPYQCIVKQEKMHNVISSEQWQNEHLYTPCERTLEQVKINELWCERVYYNNNINADYWEAQMTEESKAFDKLNEICGSLHENNESVYRFWYNNACIMCNDKKCTRGNKVECSPEVLLLSNDLTINEEVMLQNARKQRRRPCIFDVLAQNMDKLVE